MFRGREMAHPEQGLNVLESRLAEDLKALRYGRVRALKWKAVTCLCCSPLIKGAFDEG